MGCRRVLAHPSLWLLGQRPSEPQHRIGPKAPWHARPRPVEQREQWRRRRTRGPRAEHLPLLRWADGHHRDLRARLPASAVARPVNRARELMTNALVSPPPAAAPVPRRYRAGNAHAPPTATVSVAFAQKTTIPSARQHPSHGTQPDQDRLRATLSDGIPVRERQSNSEPV
jgi:hypothetical protein